MSLGAALAGVLRPGDVIVLAGDLGAGKTTLTKGLASALGVTEVVTSPTFTFVRSYSCVRGRGAIDTLVHADLFRVEGSTEAAELALSELVEDEGALAVVEWGDVAPEVIGDGSLTVTLAHAQAPEERLLSLSLSAGWEGRRDELSAAIGPWLLDGPHVGEGEAEHRQE
jgi:tRNA threonylcarbamoyladenosine biosynthesis protein TsaE